jgi:dihydroflavonol-4-reductase
MAALATGREPLLTLNGLRMAKDHMFFSSAKAERELGYHARPYIEGLRDAIDWFREFGYLR